MTIRSVVYLVFLSSLDAVQLSVYGWNVYTALFNSLALVCAYVEGRWSNERPAR
jgi:hypothetical protein